MTPADFFGPPSEGYKQFSKEMTEVMDNLKAMKGENYAQMALAIAEVVGLNHKLANSPHAMILSAFISAHITKAAAAILGVSAKDLGDDVIMLDRLSAKLVRNLKEENPNG